MLCIHVLADGCFDRRVCDRLRAHFGLFFLFVFVSVACVSLFVLSLSLSFSLSLSLSLSLLSFFFLLHLSHRLASEQ